MPRCSSCLTAAAEELRKRAGEAGPPIPPEEPPPAVEIPAVPRNISASDANKILQEYLRKPGAQGRGERAGATAPVR